jgi:hypothetical protein
MLRGDRRARTWPALLALIALLAMTRLAPSSATFATKGSPAIRSVIGDARQPEAVVQRTSLDMRVLSADLDAAAVPALVGLSIALWAMLAVSDMAQGASSAPLALLRLRGPPALSS